MTDMPKEIWIVPDMDDVPRRHWDCGVWRADKDDALDIHGEPVVEYVRADRIEALETLLTEIRDLRVEHHATMDEAEAVMPWTLWKGVLEDIKKVLGGRVMASRVKRSGVARHPFAVSRKPLLIFAYTAPSGALTGVIEASSIDAAWTIATGWGNAADIAELKAQGWRIYPCIAEWEPDQ